MVTDTTNVKVKVYCTNCHEIEMIPKTSTTVVLEYNFVMTVWLYCYHCNSRITVKTIINKGE